MADAPEMTKAIDACTVPEADTDAPQHQKVPDTAEAESQPREAFSSTTTTPAEPATLPPPRERTPAQHKRDRKKGKNRHNSASVPPPPSAEDEQHSNSEESSSSSAESSPSTDPNSPMPPPPSSKKAAKAAAGKIVPLFVASIGNPPPSYAHTLHSAGHTLLDAVRDLRAFPPWQKDRLYANGLVSRQAEAGVNKNFSWTLGLLGKGSAGKNEVVEGEENWTLWQSPSLMNVSGKALAQAFGKWKRQHGEGQLVVVHDELERALGKVSVKRGGSAKGHNGLKDLARQLPNMPYVRIGIGIGRPDSREPDVVARYVLRKMTGVERNAIEGCADEVIRKLWDVQEGRI
ncbi:Peptidyl-tRNA hydrolase [Botryosphaeria dothidea]|uniref:peptidyl-tRNA hydrolase n=1 Tax=Botryosphaeria dothidea TaxID=55169 RepID=A0A8H4N0N4_9PEZI|nr:Peptidyl-tRNA hydrolase [Botryosphaeria dothidea]